MQQHQLFVSVPGQRTVVIELAQDGTLASLKQALEDRTGIPAAEQLLLRGGRPLPPSSPLRLPNSTHLDLLLRLAGGKGGFGALLRGQGRDGKVTDNFDACRDLQGRRIRQVEAEKKLKEWAAQSKERELEKVAQQHIRDLARQQRQERDYEINVEAVRNEQRAALERVHEAVSSALAEGLGGSGSGGGSGGAGAGSSSDTDEPAAAASPAGAKRKAAAVAAGEPGGAAAAAEGAKGTGGGAAAKRQKRGGMLDMLEGSDGSDDESSDDDSDEEGA